MELAFYLSAAVAILATLRVITHTNPVRALLYLIISLLAISCVFFSFGAYFAAALEIIVYAGAIMVLFVFVVMMLNLGQSVIEQEKVWLRPSTWIGPSLLALCLLIVMIFNILYESPLKLTADHGSPLISHHLISAKEVGTALFTTYALLVQLSVMLLLGGIVVAFHIGREQRENNPNSQHNDNQLNTDTNNQMKEE